MVKKLFALLMLAACAGTDAGTEPENGDEIYGSIVGELKQEFRGKETATTQFGTQTGTQRNRCDKTSSGQVCAIPPKKTLNYCIENIQGSNWPGSTLNQVSTRIEAFDAGSDFTLNPHSAFGNFCSSLTNPVMDIIVYSRPVGSSGTGSSNVKDYGTSVFGTLSSLTEGSGVVGSYVSWQWCEMGIDVTDILNKGANSSEDANGIDHAASKSLTECLGLGGRSVGTINRATRTTFSPGSIATALSSAESCQLLNFTLSDPGQFNETSPACTGD